MEVGLDDALQHLVLTALTVDVEQVQVPRSSSHIGKNSSCFNDFQRNFLSCVSLVIFHTKGSLAFEVSLGQENGPSGVVQSVIMNAREEGPLPPTEDQLFLLFPGEKNNLSCSLIPETVLISDL